MAASQELKARAARAREEGKSEEAIALYGDAVKLDSSWSEGWWYLGTLQYELDRYAEARRAFDRVVALERENGPAAVMLGLCEFQLREFEKSLRHLYAGLTLGLGGNDELRTVATYHAAILFARFEQFELGFDLIRELAAAGKGGKPYVEAAGINVLRLPYLPSELPADKRDAVMLAGEAGFALAARRPEEARKMFLLLLDRHPTFPGIHYAYGAFLLSEAPDKAMEEFRRELAGSPSNVPARLEIAFEYLKRGTPQLGLMFAEEAVRLAPENFAARNALGRVLLETGEVARAIAELRTGVRLAPDSSEMHFALAKAYAKAGRSAEAAREREEFLRIEKERQKFRERSNTTREEPK
ncbi:MAG TPA: tetratricopeptide repeat protein [Acidobacteriota bacterium]|jgi:tetratricopeptide (TPR) repeat protein